MARRKKPYTVQISQAKAPKGLSVANTLLALDKLVDAYVRKHKGHELTCPFPPMVMVSLSSGKEVYGELKGATKESVELYPWKDALLFVAKRGEEFHSSFVHYDKVVVADMPSVISVEYTFHPRTVNPLHL